MLLIDMVLNKGREMSKGQLPDEETFPPSIRFKARRALLMAEVKAKITDGSFKPKAYICRFPENYAKTLNDLFSRLKNNE